MNNITVAGTLGKDAEIKYMPNGDPVASFSVADQQGKDKPTIWWACQLFGKRATSLAPYLLKGGAVTVSGNVSEREWQDKEGQKRYSLEVRVNELTLLGGKTYESSQAPQQQAKPKPSMDDLDDSIPF